MTEEEVVADYDVRSPASRTLLTVAGTIVAVAVLGGAVLGASILLRDTSVKTSVVDIGRPAQIVLDTGTADVRVVQGGPDVVTVTARVTSGLRTTAYELGRRGDEIKIASSCQTWLSPGCGVTATVAVPKGFPVVVRSTSGDVSADAVAQGVLTVVTGSGDVRGVRLRVDELSVETTSGDVDAGFAAQPFAVKATTTSGDVAAQVPGGERTFAVTTRSRSGDVSSSIRSDPAGEGFVRATTRSGDITLTGS